MERFEKDEGLFAKRIIEIEPSVHRIKSERESALRGFWTSGYTGFAKGERNASKRLREFFDYAREILREVSTTLKKGRKLQGTC